MPQPKMLHEQYSEAVVDIKTSDFELRRIVKDLSKSLKAYSNNAALNSVYGSALCRLGHYEEGISKLKYSIFLDSSNELMKRNLLKAHIENCDYVSAYNVIKDNSMKVDIFYSGLFGAVDNESIKAAGIEQGYIETCRLINSLTPYGTRQSVSIELDEGTIVIFIEVDIPCSTVETVFVLYETFVKKFVDRCSSKALKQIVTNFRSV